MWLEMTRLGTANNGRSVVAVKQIQAMQHPNRAFAVFARVVNGYLEVYETMRGSKKLTLRALMGREK